MCKGLEKLEINSDLVTDASIAEVLKKMNQLRHLDISACHQFNGIAFSNIDDIASK
jgi:hypothetical protein